MCPPKNLLILSLHPLLIELFQEYLQDYVLEIKDSLGLHQHLKDLDGCGIHLAVMKHKRKQSEVKGNMKEI